MLVRGADAPPPLAGTHTLQLARVQPADSGTYVCEALNAAGRDQKLVELRVLGTSRLSPHLHRPCTFSPPSAHTPQAAQAGEDRTPGSLQLQTWGVQVRVCRLDAL